MVANKVIENLSKFSLNFMIQIIGMIFFWLLPLVNIQPRALASKKDKDCGEDSLISSSSSSPGQVQHTQPDSTVRDPEWVEGDKRKIFSCEYEGCNKKYTKLSHLKVRGSQYCILFYTRNQGIIYALNGNLLSGFIKQNTFINICRPYIDMRALEHVLCC